MAVIPCPMGHTCRPRRAHFATIHRLEDSIVPYNISFISLGCAKNQVNCEPDAKTEKDLCWKVYSYVTEEYEADTKRLRDWVTNPKPNG